MTEEKPDLREYNRNNLDKSASPYLQQHADNPVWWQEWNPDVLSHAARENKPLLVSSGYSTCHWCHVMAAGAFSDPATAGYLNDHYICIKIDREQRPDIDQYLMEYIQSENGNGGWPLNVFMTPDLRPFFALTYAPARTERGRISFLEIIGQLYEYFEKYGSHVAPFLPAWKMPPVAGKNIGVNELLSYHDQEYGGFGYGQKFPPHSTLLYLLYHLSAGADEDIHTACIRTLDSMQLGGLHDHLQGGIFRYCVDREWTIPHFEKMLYDQAMALWCYSLAFKVTGKPEYRSMAEKILGCLSYSFEKEGLYITAFDADTEHHEGATYLWSHRELAEALSPQEFKELCEVYEISREGNFEGSNHLIRKINLPLDKTEHKLLTIRKSRKQPLRDDKILCGINALVAVSLIQAARYLDQPHLEQKASDIVNRLITVFWDGSALSHSVSGNVIQHQSYLSDAGAMLLAITLLYENNEDRGDLMSEFAAYVESFRKEGRWIESDADDFQKVYASWFDHPVPSGASLAETALTRTAVLTGKDCMPADYLKPFISDFFNISALIRNGMFHVYTTGKPIPWKQLPANSIQKRGKPEMHCYKEICRLIDPMDDK